MATSKLTARAIFWDEAIKVHLSEVLFWGVSDREGAAC
jgi:hypothetical protein